MKTKIFILLMLACCQAGSAITNIYNGPVNGFLDPDNWTYGLYFDKSTNITFETDVNVPAGFFMPANEVKIEDYIQVSCYGTIEAISMDVEYYGEIFSIGNGQVKAKEKINLYYAQVTVCEGGSIEFYEPGPWTECFTGRGSVDGWHGRIKGMSVFNGDENVTIYLDKSYVSGVNHIDGDIDGKGKVDFADIAILAENWLQGG